MTENRNSLIKKDFVYWLRWIAVLPGAVLAGVLSSFPLHWFISLTYLGLENYEGGNFLRLIKPETLEYILTPAVAAFAFIWAGANIAPERRVKIAGALLFLSCTFLIIGNFFFLQFVSEVKPLTIIVGLILAIVGSVYGYQNVLGNNQ